MLPSISSFFFWSVQAGNNMCLLAQTRLLVQQFHLPTAKPSIVSPDRFHSSCEPHRFSTVLIPSNISVRVFPFFLTGLPSCTHGPQTPNQSFCPDPFLCFSPLAIQPLPPLMLYPSSEIHSVLSLLRLHQHAQLQVFYQWPDGRKLSCLRLQPCPVICCERKINLSCLQHMVERQSEGRRSCVGCMKFKFSHAPCIESEHICTLFSFEER